MSALLAAAQAGIIVGAGTNVSNSVAEHPLAYFTLAALTVAMLLYIIFDGRSGVSQSVFFALFSSPLSITIFALIVGYGLDSELPTVLGDNSITVGSFGVDQASRGIAVGLASVLWLFLIAKWAGGRAPGPRRGMQEERPLSPEMQRVADNVAPYSIRADRDPSGRRIKKP